MPKDVCIIAAAQGISKDVINRFRDCIKYSRPSVSYDVRIGNSKEKKFYKTKILNQLLRDNLKNYSVIIQTDIDLVVPHGLIDFTCEMLRKQHNNGFHHNLRYVDPQEIKGIVYKDYPWNRWKTLPTTFCSGCWNGMYSKVWRKSCGWCEDMFAWGSEDSEFYNRSLRKGIRWMKCDKFPLVHINHKPRQRKRANQNMSEAKKYSDKTDWIKGKIVMKENK